jgi:hypothetical protein
MMVVQWRFDGSFWRLEPNPPDCEAAVFELNGKFCAVVNGWSPCTRVEEHLSPSLDISGYGGIPQSRQWDTLEEAQAYCEQRLKESVMRSALALGIEINSIAGTTTATTLWGPPIVLQS